MIEPEIAFADLNDDAQPGRGLPQVPVPRRARRARATTWPSSPSACEKTAITRLEAFVNAPFERIDYTDAVALLQKSGQKFDFPVEWGLDLQTEHERWLTEQHVGRPVVVMNYPEQIKAFYMRLNDDGKTVAAMDVLAPGIGEIIGGSQREERLDVLDARMAQFGLDPAHYELVPRFPPLRHRAARRLRPGLRAAGGVRLRPGQHPRRDPLSARARHTRSSDRDADDPVLRPAASSPSRSPAPRAFVIFWPLALVHMRDRHPEIAAQLGAGAFLKPSALRVAAARRLSRDAAIAALSGLATPARISLLRDPRGPRHGRHAVALGEGMLA